MAEEREASAGIEDPILQRIFSTLESSVSADPYSADGSYAKQIHQLPVGLRSMAATQHLDVGLTLDDIGWHFLNFGEPNLVAETEAGLRTLGMTDLAEWFHEAYQIVAPFLPSEDVDAYLKWMNRDGRMKRIAELTRRATELDEESKVQGSAIYGAWVRYARQHPERVFPS